MDFDNDEDDNVTETGGSGNTYAAEKLPNGSFVQYFKLLDGTDDGMNRAVVDADGNLCVKIAGGVEISGDVVVTDIEIAAELPAGTNTIGGVTQSGTWNIGEITTIPSIPTGSNIIGAVTQSGTWDINEITTLPNITITELPDVTIAELPALATGSNVIGAVTQSGTWDIGSITTLPDITITSLPDVTITELPALATGSNVIGAVTQSGTWDIGTITSIPDVTITSLPDVTITELPALATGSNVIGAVTQSGTWDIGTITSIPDVTITALPDVTITELPALATGSNVIGAVTQSGTWDIGTITSIPDITVTELPDVVVSTMPDLTIAELPELPAGNNLIGTVNVNYPAGLPYTKFLTAAGDGTGSNNLIGDYSGEAPTDFYYGPTSSQIYYVHQVSIQISDVTSFNQVDYGGMAAGLTNGVKFLLKTGVPATEIPLLGGYAFKQNDDYFALTPHVTLTTFAGTPQTLSVNFEIEEDFGTPLILNGATTDQFVVRLQDDLTGLTSHRFVLHGRLVSVGT